MAGPLEAVLKFHNFSADVRVGRTITKALYDARRVTVMVDRSFKISSMAAMDLDVEMVASRRSFGEKEERLRAGRI